MIYLSSTSAKDEDVSTRNADLWQLAFINNN